MEERQDLPAPPEKEIKKKEHAITAYKALYPEESVLLGHGRYKYKPGINISSFEETHPEVAEMSEREKEKVFEGAREGFYSLEKIPLSRFTGSVRAKVAPSGMTAIYPELFELGGEGYRSEKIRIVEIIGNKVDLSPCDICGSPAKYLIEDAFFCENCKERLKKSLDLKKYPYLEIPETNISEVPISELKKIAKHYNVPITSFPLKDVSERDLEEFYRWQKRRLQKG